jgi:chemotaxis protein MotB
MAGKGGGAWKVAYADFVTAMMAFFLVMWIVAQSDQVKQAIAHHFNDPFARESEEEGTAHQKPPRHPAPARTTKHPEHEKEAGGSHSVLLNSHGGERTSIGAVVHFADDSAELDAEARRRLAELAPLVVGKPQKLELRGHTSRRPLPPDSPFADHWDLSYRRCLAVMQELEKLGVPPQRIRLSQVAGFEPPAAPDSQLPGGGYARVEVTLLAETVGTRVSQGSAEKPPKTSKTVWSAAEHEGPASKVSTDQSPYASDAPAGTSGHPNRSYTTPSKSHGETGHSHSSAGRDHSSSPGEAQPSNVKGHKAAQEPAHGH